MASDESKIKWSGKVHGSKERSSRAGEERLTERLCGVLLKVGMIR